VDPEELAATGMRPSCIPWVLLLLQLLRIFRQLEEHHQGYFVDLSVHHEPMDCMGDGVVEEEDEEGWDDHSPRGSAVAEFEDAGHNREGREALSPQDGAVGAGTFHLEVQSHYQQSEGKAHNGCWAAGVDPFVAAAVFAKLDGHGYAHAVEREISIETAYVVLLSV